jgi:NADH-quinone oxidoreductase subunit M
MILVDLIIILMLGGFLSWIVSKWSALAARWIAFVAVVIDFILTLILWLGGGSHVNILTRGQWIRDFQLKWIPELGVSFHLALDGLSLVMIALTLFIGGLSILVSWKEIRERIGFFHFNILWLLAGILGVFLSMDLLLFYFFWEVMLVPMFFILGIWGYENRKFASIKFFLFTQLSGLLMLIAILGLYFVHGHQTGTYTFDYFALLGTSIPGKLAFWLMCGFLIAFVVKLPALPFHSWLPDAYTQSPTAGSVILAGLMSKTAAYGMLRFVLPLFPDAARTIAPLAILLGVAGILYGAKMAYAQKDLKRLVAFSSLSHMGFIMVGIFSFQALAYQGTVLEMVTHGISISALFIIAGALKARTGTRDMSEMGGFWKQMPAMGGITLIFVLASLGLPGLGNFIAEFLILAGAFQSSVLWAVLATVGLISSMIYSLVILQRIFHGQPQKEGKLVDFSAREFIIMACLIIVIFWLGFFPPKVISTVSPVFDKLEQQMNVSFSPGQRLLQGASEGQVSPEDALRLNRGEPSIVYLRNNTKGGARW